MSTLSETRPARLRLRVQPLTAEAFEVHVPKAYIYAAMSFSLVVEFLNIRSRAKRLAKAQAKNAASAYGVCANSYKNDSEKAILVKWR